MSSDGAWTNTLSPRAHAVLYLAILALLAFLLWGVYLPLTRHVSAGKIELGDRFIERAHALEATDSAANQEISDRINDHINRIYPIVSLWEEYSPRGGYDPEASYNRRIREAVHSAEKDIHDLDGVLLKVMEDANLLGSFKALADRIRERAVTVKELHRKVNNAPLDLPGSADYNFLCNVQIPNLLGDARRVRDLFDVEACYDRAMQEYFEAIGNSRLWTEPRLKMARLYRDRDWFEFSMEEYLRIMKIDGDQGHGPTAYDEIRAFAGRHVEADFYIALAHLLKGDDAAGLKSLRSFLSHAPTNVRASKAYELMTRLEAGDRTFVKRFLRDEVWI